MLQLLTALRVLLSCEHKTKTRLELMFKVMFCAGIKHSVNLGQKQHSQVDSTNDLANQKWLLDMTIK